MRQKISLTLVTIFVAFAIWSAVAYSGIFNKLLLPTPVEVFWNMVEILSTGKILPDVVSTLYKTFAAFAGGASIGIVVGLVMGYYNRIYNALEFIVDFLRSVPATALFPLFLLFLGIGDEAKIAVAIFASSFVVIVNTMYGVRNRSATRTNYARTLKMKGVDLFRKIILPDAAPHIFAGLRIAISLALIVVVVTEMFIGTNQGLGRRIIDSQLIYNIPEMFSAIIITGIIGYLINSGLIFFERKKVHWSGK